MIKNQEEELKVELLDAFNNEEVNEQKKIKVIFLY